jgi:hypothetical protein
MSRSYDFVVAGVVTLVAFAMHRLMVGMVTPGTALWDVATTGTAVFNGLQNATWWMEIGTVWIPIIGIGGVWAWVLIREYRRQVATGVGQARRPPI